MDAALTTEKSSGSEITLKKASHTTQSKHLHNLKIFASSKKIENFDESTIHSALICSQLPKLRREKNYLKRKSAKINFMQQFTSQRKK